jgi:Protein of unknown function (DUF2808)
MSYAFRIAFGASHRPRLAQTVLLIAGLLLSSSFAPVSANPFGGSKVGFSHIPRLVGATTTQLAAFVSGGTDEFTLTVPVDAGAPLQAVTLSQAENAAKIQFAPAQSQAVANGIPVPISAIGGATRDDITIVFDQPIQPGSTVTISLSVNQNAGTAGSYLFGVTAYPVGDSVNGLFLGYGRITLFGHGG